MTKGTFKIGDIVTGLRGNGYNLTNADMTKGEVVYIYQDGDMKVKILEHTDRCRVGGTWIVNNTGRKFKLVEEVKEVAEEVVEPKRTIQLDSEIEIEKLKGKITKETTDLGVKIVSADAKLVKTINQYSEISNCSNFRDTRGSIQREDRTAEYYLKGNKITCIRTIDGVRGKGVAKCSPEDKFDLRVGIRLSGMRARINIEEKNIKGVINGTYTK